MLRQQYGEIVLKHSPCIKSFSPEAVDPLDVEGNLASVSVSIEYRNYLGVDIVVLDRRGIEFVIPHRFTVTDSDRRLRIREQYNLKEGCELRFNENELDDDMVNLHQKMMESIKMDSMARRTTRKVAVDTSIDISDFRKANYCVYIKEYDIVVYVDKPGISVLHPTTVSSVINGYDLTEKDPSAFSFHIDINDPDGRMGERFINVCGCVYTVRPTRDKSIREGAVIQTHCRKTGKTTNVPMSLEEFDKQIESWRSLEEAEVFGNKVELTKKKAEEQLEKLRHENQVSESKLKGDIVKQKSEYEKVKHELELTQSDLKNHESKHKKEMELLQAQLSREKHSIELQSLQRKNYYEERSYDRKDSSELIKFLPMVIGAGLVLLFK